jgi:penicillin-binding protein 1C
LKTGHLYRRLKSKPAVRVIFLLLILLCLFLLVPPPRFDSPHSTVVMAKDGSLLGARVASDDQWRFPDPEVLPGKYKKALICFEDEYFYFHPGVNPVSLARALYRNIRAGMVVGGGSTITMQVARMSRNAPRTIGNKLWETVRAIRLELAAGKEDILIMYAANAPFGGNIVGFEAASWHYFQRSPQHLTWAESALLAVLPNAPGILRPDANPGRLKDKRDMLLQKLFERNIIDATELMLSVGEPLPGGPRRLPNMSSHLVDWYAVRFPGQMIITTIDAGLQERSTELVSHYGAALAANGIHHAGVIIVEIGTGNVVACVGNTPAVNSSQGHAVDMVRAQRSSGSILKPFLYAAALQDGTILPRMLLPDVPTQYRNYAPRNFHRRFHGAVPAGEALTRSLNIPFVRLLHEYGGERFLNVAAAAGMSTLDKGYDHYGLSLILGGGESTLWELAAAYASMGRTLRDYTANNGMYSSGGFAPLRLVDDRSAGDPELTAFPEVYSAGAIWHTFEAMKGVVRPPEEAGWENFSSRQNIAWKTGTSFGLRDAWSIGISGDYVVAVWAGNASGEGRPGLMGGTAAAPLMFRLFDLLPDGDWFAIPYDDLIEIVVCKSSGHRAGPSCPDTERALVPNSVRGNPACPYHRLVHLTADRRYRTTVSCEPDGEVVTEAWFSLPPLMAWYYRMYNAGYLSLPPVKPGCFDDGPVPLEFIYPYPGAAIITPVDLDGRKQGVVFRIAHASPAATVYWHLNDSYIATTTSSHEIELTPVPGRHSITVVDGSGNRLVRNFTVLK